MLTLWAAAGAEFLAFERDEALTLGRAVAGLNAYSKGVSLGLFQPTPKEVKEQRRKMGKDETVTIDLLHRPCRRNILTEGCELSEKKGPSGLKAYRSTWKIDLATLRKMFRELCLSSPSLCRPFN